ncbi:MAG: hypothetical protein D6702_01370 [Planctomycetota bacterium]|nr:MAG: hypothetical protein D6702_01370 [Planctomycetota bacterium]
MLPSLAFLLSAAALPQDPGHGFDQAALQAKVDEILPRVAELRGWEFKKPVPAGVKTPEEFLDYAKEEFESEYGAEQLAAMAQEYRLLGLMDPDLDLWQAMLDLLQSQVGGFYDPKTEAFYMISTFNAGLMADIIMAHELTHALDDQYYQLDRMMAKASGLSTDAEFAVRAVVEGSGTSLMSLYSVQGAMKGWLDMSDPDALEEMKEMMAASTEGLAGAPPFLVMTLALPYLEGNKFLARESNTMKATMTAPDPDELDHAFRRPPRSSEQVLHFEKYWDDEQWDPPVPVDLSRVANRLGALGWELLDQDTYGELACFVVTEEEPPNLADPMAQMSAVWTNEAATGWGGDTLQLYRNEAGGHLAVWATVWDTAADAGEFSAALRETARRNPFLRSVDEGETAVVAVFADDAAAAGAAEVREAVRRAVPKLFE